jgi:glycosyltransferase involved in cell wall biosynthesis
MSPKISIVLPCAGDNRLRSRNFSHCVKSITEQEYSDYEVIVVEQSLDRSFYKKWVTDLGFKWIGIRDPLNRGFNLSWCRNVGAREAKGEKLVLMDADMSFDSKYFNSIAEDNNNFSGGAETYHWIWDETVTEVFDVNRDFTFVYNYGEGGPRDSVFRFTPFTKGCGYGAILVYNREWYWNELGGYIEDFFKYGWEDKAAVELMKYILKVDDDSTLPKIKHQVIHLSHASKDFDNINKNEGIYRKVEHGDKNEIINRLRSCKNGDANYPSIIF